jgi:ornithine cyclodeaminase/alanine dehydrogenase-like protein (mu-crystallin family)
MRGVGYAQTTMHPAPRDLHIISGAELRELLPYDQCVAAVEQAMRNVSAGTVLMPLRQFMPLPSGDGRLAWMPGYLGDPECFGIKLLSLFPGNPKVGLSSHVGLYVLYESVHGRPVAIMEASALTAIRTAAASVVASRALARADARTLAVIGTGEEARSHIDAFQAVRPFARVIVWGRREEAARALAEHAGRAGCAQVEVAASVAAAAAEADVICTVTGSPTALLFGRDVRPGTHLCLVGASIPSSREVDDDLVAMSRYFVDYRGSALAQAGELLDAIKAGRVAESHIVGEIGDVLSGTVAGRTSQDDVTVYKSLGVAAQDLASALVVYGHALERGMGMKARL